MNPFGSQKSSKGDETRERIKQSARSLFAQHGLENVTVRDIAELAGQKNWGSVNYHFGSKDNLIIEILADVGRDADRNRGATLDRLEGSGAPIALRDIIRVMIGPQDASDQPMIRLFVMLQLYRPDLAETILNANEPQTYLRCLAYLRDMLPGCPAPILRQRLKLITSYAWLFLATRADDAKPGAADTPSLFENLLDVAEGALLQPPSETTLATLTK